MFKKIFLVFRYRFTKTGLLKIIASCLNHDLFDLSDYSDSLLFMPSPIYNGHRNRMVPMLCILPLENTDEALTYLKK
jgi:hypothetical protein